MTPGWSAVRRVLAVRLDNIGDLVMCGPALRALKAALPQATLTLLASPAGATAAPLLPWVDEVIPHRALWQDARGELGLDPSRERAFIADLAARHFDVAFIFTSWAQTPYAAAYALYLAGIPTRIGHSAAFGGAVLTDSVSPPAEPVHQTDRALHLLRAVGLPTGSSALEVRVPPPARAVATRRLKAAGLATGRPFVAIAPGASAAARRYPPDRFAEVVRLLDAAGLPAVVVGGDRDAGAAAPLVAAGAHSVVGTTSVPQLAAILERSGLVITNNSAPMHLADAMGRPQVVLFAGTEDTEQYAPRSAPARVLNRPTTCAPCRNFHCPYDLECLDLAPELVARTSLELLGHGRAPAERDAAGTEALCAS